MHDAGVMKILIPLILLIGLGSLPAKTLEDVISKARAFVGPEDKLEAIDVLFYQGILKPENGASDRLISLLLEKPARQRLEITQGSSRITMVVNDAEGFMTEENLDTGTSRTVALPLDQVRLFKANAKENLYFFRFPASAQVRAKYLGEQQFRGETVDAVRYLHPNGIVFFRYFNPETGDLVATQTDTDTINVEKGEMRVDGLRFGKEVLSFEGDEQVHTITFDRVQVNPEIVDGLFDYPEGS